MRLAVYNLSVVLLCLFFSCSSSSNSSVGEIISAEKADTTIGYCYQLYNDVLEEALEIMVQGNKVVGKGIRTYRSNQTTYTLKFEGTMRNGKAEMTVNAQNTGNKKNPLITHSEDWILGDKQLLVERRSIEEQNGQFTYTRTRCQSYNNKDNTLYDVFGPYKDGYAVVGKNGRFGLVNEAGELTISIKYRDLGNANEGYVAYYDEDLGLYGMLDVNGNIMIEPKFIELMAFSEGRAAFMDQEGNWGFLDNSLQVVIPAQFSGVYFYKGDAARKSFQEGLANVQLENKRWCFINKNGEVVIRGDFIYADPFREGRARVFKDNKWYFINKSGACVENCD